MKVTDIKTFTVDCFRTNWVFVKVYTDEGVTGVGKLPETGDKARFCYIPLAKSIKDAFAITL